MWTVTTFAYSVVSLHWLVITLLLMHWHTGGAGVTLLLTIAPLVSLTQLGVFIGGQTVRDHVPTGSQETTAGLLGRPANITIITIKAPQ